MTDDQELQARGWQAIDDALVPIYGDQEPRHWGAIVPYELGGPDPIRGISAYRVYEPRCHWHFITFGFSELYEKESEDAEISGFGFELTFRLACEPDEEPPNWALSFLQNLGRYVFETGNGFGPGHTMPLNGPIAQGSDTAIRAISFAIDPQLGKIDTPNGCLDFLQIIGLTEVELRTIQCWNAEAFISLIAQRDPLLITDLDRDSFMDDVEFAKTVQKRTRTEGSSCGELVTNLIRFKRSGLLHARIRIVMGALVVPDFKFRLAGRIPYERPLAVCGAKQAVLFEPGESINWTVEDDLLSISLPVQTAVDLIASLEAKTGEYRIPGSDSLLICVERTDITDDDGRIVKTVG